MESCQQKIIAIAEESDFILNLGEWLIGEACKQISLWKNRGYTGLYMAINMSTRQFDKKYKSISLLKKLIQQYQLPGKCIQLEITENLVYSFRNYRKFDA